MSCADFFNFNCFYITYFSSKELVKTRLHNKVEHDFIVYTLSIYTEKNITKTFTTK